MKAFSKEPLSWDFLEYLERVVGRIKNNALAWGGENYNVPEYFTTSRNWLCPVLHTNFSGCHWFLSTALVSDFLSV